MNKKYKRWHCCNDGTEGSDWYGSRGRMRCHVTQPHIPSFLWDFHCMNVVFGVCFKEMATFCYALACSDVGHSKYMSVRHRGAFRWGRAISRVWRNKVTSLFLLTKELRMGLIYVIWRKAFLTGSVFAIVFITLFPLRLFLWTTNNTVLCFSTSA